MSGCLRRNVSRVEGGSELVVGLVGVGRKRPRKSRHRLAVARGHLPQLIRADAFTRGYPLMGSMS